MIGFPRPPLTLAAGLGLLAALSVGNSSARADAVSELASFSVFEGVNLEELAKGDAKTQRGPAMSNQRFQSVQSCWVSPGSPAQVTAALRSFNPARHSELNVLLHSNGSNFEQLSKVPNDGPVQWLVNATVQKSTDLQISREEAAKLPASGSSMSGPVVAFWSGLLASRAQAFASGGSAAQAAYSFTGTSFRPGEELSGLLGQQGKIRKQFASLIQGTGIAGSGKGEPYWELLDLDKKGVLTLGASYTRTGSGEASQAADVLYYASGGFYVGLTLYQLWPVTVDGRASTLVWRGDLISSAGLTDLHGVERLGSESAMLKDVSKSVRAFRSDSGGSR